MTLNRVMDASVRVVCPTCRRKCALRKDGSIRSHSCEGWIARQSRKRCHKSKAEMALRESRRIERSMMFLDDQGRQIAEEHMNWATYWTMREWRRMGERQDFEELRSAAYLGVVRAAYRFKRKGVTNIPFKLFAQKFIVGNIRRFVSEQMRADGFAWATREQKGPMVQMVRRVPIECVP